MAARIIVGVDGGGTRTRAMAITTSGQVLAFTEAGPTSPKHTNAGQANVRQAIQAVVQQAGCQLSDVVYLVAGLSGLDSADDHTWAEQYTAVAGLNCPRLQVNDTVVAHFGAFGSQPGVLAIAGTGSNVFAMTDTGQQIRNGDFLHYAPAAAVHLSNDSLLRMLAGDAEVADQAFVAKVLEYWQVASVGALQAKGAQGFVPDRLERLSMLSEMAPLVTAAAQEGSPLARAVCHRAADALALGIRVLGACFTTSAVSVAVIGSVAQSSYMRSAIQAVLNHQSRKDYQLIDPVYTPVAGAVLLGAQEYAGGIEQAVFQNIQQHPQAVPQTSA